MYADVHGAGYCLYLKPRARELVALVCANCLTGTIYASTINPRTTLEELYFEDANPHRYGARAKHGGMLPPRT